MLFTPLLPLNQLDDEVELEDGEPEDDGQDEDGRHDQEHDDLEPYVIEDNDHVEEETEGEEYVWEVGGEPGNEEEMVESDAAPGCQEVGQYEEDVD